ELCMSPFGDACNNQAATFFNTSLSNSLLGDYEEFTIEYVNGSEIIGIWANDTIIINTQTFEQMHFGLPKDIKGTENITIPDTISGQIGNNESNITYYHQPFSTAGTARLYVSNIYIDGIPMNHSGNASFNSEFPNIQLDDAIANLIAKSLSGGKYSNGSAIADCYTSSPNYDLSFEFENQNNQKWRLQLPSIIGKPIDSAHCSLTINGNAINSDSRVFGSAFIANFYMVFDQEKSLFGIALR
ncbi:21586_t:CDS:2, partial [Gigaspora margarita]